MSFQVIKSMYGDVVKATSKHDRDEVCLDGMESHKIYTISVESSKIGSVDDILGVIFNKC